MKKIFLFICAVLLVSCTEDDSRNVSDVTNYATFDFEPVVAIPVGGTFTPAATATEGGVDIPVEVDGTVDTSTVGAYSVTYSAVNSDGYAASVTQTVVVHDPSIVGTDVSGNYQDKNNNARKGVISLVPGTTSIFYATDFGFAGAFPIYFQMDGDTISEIEQVYPLGQESIELTYNPSTEEFGITIQPAGFSYTFEYY
jgi:hypothetical protein